MIGGVVPVSSQKVSHLSFFKLDAHGVSAALPPLALQYADFAVWQRAWLAEGTRETHLAWWRDQLTGAPEFLSLPTDRPRPPVQTFHGASHTLTLAPTLSQGVRALSRQQGVTLFTTILAAFQVLLMRESGEYDLVVGVPVANRTRVELEPLIGMFVNTLAIRSKLQDAEGDAISVAALLAQVQQTMLEAQRYQDVPFEQVVEALQPTRSLSHTPLFQVMCNLLYVSDVGLHLPDVNIEVIEADYPIAKFDLTFTVGDGGDDAVPLTAALEYNTDLFDPATIARMAGHFVTLLAGMVADPTASVATLPMLTEAERHQLVVEWNDTAADCPQDRCIHDLFAEQVVRTPDAVAVIFEEQQLTYAELNTRANQLAHHLIGLGVGPDVLVGLCVERSLEMVVGLLGILKAGGAYVPLDPSYPTERVAFMVDDSAVPVLLTQTHLLATLPPTSAHVVCLDREESIVATQPETLPASGVQPHHLAYVIYTSGSTGTPKGVMIVQRGLTNYLNWALTAYPVTNGCGSPVQSSLSFDATITSLWTPLLTGKMVVLVPKHGELEVLNALLQADSAFSLVKLTPAHLKGLYLLLSEGANPRGTHAFIVGGEALFGRDVAWWRHAAPQIRMINEYGPTETVVGCCVYEVPTRADFDAAIPIGRPIANTQVYVLDLSLQPIPIGVEGELYIGGAGLARGYLNRPELTAERFIVNPFGPGRLYRTGDRACWRHDGNLEYLGRLDDQVKLRGFRIELGEIETVLSSHPAVQACVVTLREDCPGDPRLVAYMVAHEPDADLRGFLQARLPNYMVPGVFVSLDTLPLTPNGKVDRKALPAPNQQRLGAPFSYPRSPIERQLVQIWEEILRVYPVGIADDFFVLGGHSLLAVRLLACVNHTFGTALPLRTLFTHPTVAQMSTVLDPAMATVLHTSVVAIQPRGSRPAIFCCPGAGGAVVYFHALAQALGFEQPVYGLEARGLDGIAPPHTTVESAAAYQVEALLQQQPTGPYILLGHSFGGLMAFAIAQELLRTGAEIRALIILDGLAPETPAQSLDEVEAVLLYEQLYLESVGSTPRLSAAQLQPLSTEQRLALLHESLMTADLLPQNANLDQTRGIIAVAVTNHSTTYHPATFHPLPIHLILAADEPEVLQHALIDGWSRYGEVHIARTPGTHTNIMYAPQVEHLAQTIATLMQEPTPETRP